MRLLKIIVYRIAEQFRSINDCARRFTPDSISSLRQRNCMSGKRTRRKFLSETVKAVGGAVCVSAAVEAATTPGGGQTYSPLKLNRDTFAALLNTTFLVQCGESEKQKLLLVQVAGQDSKSLTGPKVETFSLLFKQGGSRTLGQDTYRFFHPTIGQFEMFIVPVMRSEGKHQRQRYEAVFNQLV